MSITAWSTKCWNCEIPLYRRSHIRYMYIRYPLCLFYYPSFTHRRASASSNSEKYKYGSPLADYWMITGYKRPCCWYIDGYHDNRVTVASHTDQIVLGAILDVIRDGRHTVHSVTDTPADR